MCGLVFGGVAALQREIGEGLCVLVRRVIVVGVIAVDRDSPVAEKAIVPVVERLRQFQGPGKGRHCAVAAGIHEGGAEAGTQAHFPARIERPGLGRARKRALEQLAALAHA